jgi:hypothetical protein
VRETRPRPRRNLRSLIYPRDAIRIDAGGKHIEHMRLAGKTVDEPEDAAKVFLSHEEVMEDNECAAGLKLRWTFLGN